MVTLALALLPVSTRFTGTGRYKTVQVSTRFPVQVQDCTRLYKSVPKIHLYHAYRWYRSAQLTVLTGNKLVIIQSARLFAKALEKGGIMI